jgi:hypothetical protein
MQRSLLIDFVAPAFVICAILGLAVGLACGMKIGAAKAAQAYERGLP